MIKQGKPTTVTLDMQVLSEFDSIPLEILNTAIIDCLNVKMNVLGIQFSNRGLKLKGGDVE